MRLDEFLGSAFACGLAAVVMIFFGTIRRRMMPVKHRRALRRLCLAMQSKPTPPRRGLTGGCSCAIFFYEHQMREQLHELKALDRRLEPWGWFRRVGATQESPGWRYRAGAVLVRFGEWLKREGVSTRVPGSGGAAVE